MDSSSLLVLVLLAAFAIDRTSHAIVYAVSLSLHLGTESKAKTVLYFCIASVLSLLFIYCWRPLPILSGLPAGKLGPAGTELLDGLFTFIVLVGGGDRISALLDSSLKPSAPMTGTREPLVLTGEVRVEEGRKA